MPDFTNIVILLGIGGIVLLACVVVVGAVVLKSVGTLKKELLGQREQTDVHVHPNPLTVREQTEFATLKELERHAEEDSSELAALSAEIKKVDADATAQFAAMAKEMQEMERRMIEAGSKRASALHARLDRVTVGLATIGGRLGVSMPKEEL